MNPNISVIIPYHNESKSLGTTLDLIVSQTYPPTEVLMVDSSSTDDSFAIIEDWIGKNRSTCNIEFRNIQEGTNVPSSSKNVGIKHAREDILAFMDCGLLFDSNWLKSQIEYLQSHDAEIVSGQCYFQGIGLIDQSAIAQTYGYKRLRPTVPSTMLKKSVFEKTGLFLENKRAGYDVDWVKKLEREKIKRWVNEDVTIRYDGTNFADSFRKIALKAITYSEPTVGIYGYRYPYYYIAIGIMAALSVPFMTYGYAAMLLSTYIVLRGFVIPGRKSRGLRLVTEKPLAVFVLPIVGMIIDAGNLVGYTKGAVKAAIRAAVGRQ